MAFNLFKREKKTKSGKNFPIEPVEPAKETAPAASLAGLSAGRAGADSSLVLRGGHVTEKSGLLNSFNQYVFKVAPRSNKIEIKKAVEKMYGVKVDRVMISMMPSKKRRLGRFEGEKSGFKKAVVKLVAGQKIDIMPK